MKARYASSYSLCSTRLHMSKRCFQTVCFKLLSLLYLAPYVQALLPRSPHLNMCLQFYNASSYSPCSTRLHMSKRCFQEAPSEYVSPILQCRQFSLCRCLCLLPSPRCLLQFLYLVLLGSTCSSDASQKPL
jgi:hypothetical protein